MPPERTRRIRAHAIRAAGAVLLPTLALAFAACGSSSAPAKGTNPATLAPAAAPLYVGAEVRPSGSLQASARAVAQALAHQPDPYLRLLQALQTPGSPSLDYARQVRPWLGAQAGVFLASLNGSTGVGAAGEGAGALLNLLQRAFAGEPTTTTEFPFSSAGADGAVLLDTTDAGKARAFLATQAARARAHASSYRGVAYRVTNAGVAFAMVKDLVVLGSEAALHGVIDTSLGAPALAGTAAYAKLAAVAPSGALAHLYVNPARAASARGAARAANGEANALLLLSALNGGRPLNASLIPGTNSLALDLDSLAASSPNASGGLLAAWAAGGSALGELPAESWLGVGLGGSASSLGAGVRGLRSVLSLVFAGAGTSNATLSVKGLLAGILAPLDVLGAETAAARRDFQSWMSSAALFASGSGLLNFKGGVVILSSNPAASREAVGKLSLALRRSGMQVAPATIAGTDAAISVRVATLPLPLDIADGRDAAGRTKFVVGLGEGSVTAPLTATSTLAGGPALTAAAGALGEGVQPSMTIDFPTLLGLLEGAGLTEDPTIAPFIAYLRSLTTLAGGGSRPAGGVERLRISAGLRQSEPAG